jgi:hypothetical protein
MPLNMAGEIALEKCLMRLKKELTKVTLALIVLSILASAAAITPVANAQDQALILSPAQGPAGTFVSVIGMGFSANSQVDVSFETTHVANGYTGSMFGRMQTSFTVPSVPLGTYTVTATDGADGYAETTFTVTLKSTTPAPTATPTPAPTATPTATATQTFPTPTGTTTTPFPTATAWSYPTFRPTKTPVPASGGFWSPLVIGVIVAVVIVLGISVAFVIRGRGKREKFLDEELPVHKPEPSAPLTKPTTAARYSQPSNYGQQSSMSSVNTRYSRPSSYSQPFSKPATTARYGQPSRYGQRQSFTKICPRCKRVVKDDYNLCPYCDKRLR